LTTQDVSRAIPVTTSLIVAEQFGKDHAKVLRDIRELAEQLEEVSIGQSDFGQSYFVGESEYINEQNKKQPMYQMNEDFWMMLVMGYTGKKALLIKHEFIKQFRKMKHELMARAETRHIGKNARLSLTDSINNHVENTGNFKKFAYGNYTKLVYKKVLGMECKKAKELRNVPEKGNLRDYLLPEELDKVQDIESKIAGFIAVSDTEGKNDKEIYQMVKEWIDKKEII
jgi:Rha family phage regulatory protein